MKTGKKAKQGRSKGQTDRRGQSGRPGTLRGAPLWLGLGLIILLLAIWVPTWTAQGTLPETGAPIEDFTLHDAAGSPFQLSEAYADDYVILVFYRGHF